MILILSKCHQRRVLRTRQIRATGERHERKQFALGFDGFPIEWSAWRIEIPATARGFCSRVCPLGLAAFKSRCPRSFHRTRFMDHAACYVHAKRVV